MCKRGHAARTSRQSALMTPGIVFCMAFVCLCVCCLPVPLDGLSVFELVPICLLVRQPVCLSVSLLVCHFAALSVSRSSPHIIWRYVSMSVWHCTCLAVFSLMQFCMGPIRLSAHSYVRLLVILLEEKGKFHNHKLAMP